MDVSKRKKDDAKLKDENKAGLGKGATDNPSDRPKSKPFDYDKAGKPADKKIDAKNVDPRKVKEGAEDEDLNIGTDTV
jgi:hypothetical protein